MNKKISTLTLIVALFLPFSSLRASLVQEEQTDIPPQQQEDSRQETITNTQMGQQDSARQQQSNDQTQVNSPNDATDTQSVDSEALVAEPTAKLLFQSLADKNIRQTCKALFKTANKKQRKSFDAFLLAHKGQEARELKIMVNRAKEIEYKRKNRGAWASVWAWCCSFVVPTMKHDPYKQAYLERASRGANWYQRALAVFARPFVAGFGSVGGIFVSGAFDKCTELCDGILTMSNPFAGFGNKIQQTAAGAGIAATAALGAALVFEGLLLGGPIGLLGGLFGAFAGGVAGFGVYYLLRYYGFGPGTSLIGGLFTAVLTMYIMRKILQKYYRHRAGKKGKKTKSKKVRKDNLGYYFLDEDGTKIHINVN